MCSNHVLIYIAFGVYWLWNHAICNKIEQMQEEIDKLKRKIEGGGSRGEE